MLFAAVTLHACGDDDPVQDEPETPALPAGESNILVAYFSATGNTQTVAQHIAHLLGADLFRITAADGYATDPYDVHNVAAGYSHTFRNGMKLTPQVRVDNLFDSYYESTQYYPMPLRNCLFSLLWEF